MLLITGPSGNVGQELVTLLDNADLSQGWRVASRHPQRLGERAAEAVHLDFTDASTWSSALKDVTSLFLFPLPSNTVARQAIIPFIGAAERAGCRHVVYISVFGADRAPFIPHHQVEQALRTSTMATTILRCSFFMQNLHRSISTHGLDIVERGELFIPAGNGATTFLDARDAAAVAAQALTAPPPLRDTVHHLTGPAALTMDQVAAVLTDILGFEVRYTHPGLIAFTRWLRRRGTGWDILAFMAAIYTLTRIGANQPLTDDVHQLLGRSPHTLEEFVSASAWRWREQQWT